MDGKGIDCWPTFLSTNLSDECWVRLNRSATLSKALKKVAMEFEWKLIESSLNLIKLLPDFHTTFYLF